MKTNNQLADEILTLIDGMDDDSDNQKLYNGMEYFCDVTNRRQGMKLAIRLQVQNEDMSELNVELKAQLTKLLTYLTTESKKDQTCAYCGEPMYGLIQVHHHTENGKDVTK